VGLNSIAKNAFTCNREFIPSPLLSESFSYLLLGHLSG
jgi:hypothetical protein